MDNLIDVKGFSLKLKLHLLNYMDYIELRQEHASTQLDDQEYVEWLNHFIEWLQDTDRL